MDLGKILFDSFNAVNDLYTKPRELAAIWLTKPVTCGSGRTVRIATGEMVRVNTQTGDIEDAGPDKPVTHRVAKCWGTTTSQFELHLESLETGEVTVLKLS